MIVIAERAWQHHLDLAPLRSLDQTVRERVVRVGVGPQQELALRAATGGQVELTGEHLPGTDIPAGVSRSRSPPQDHAKLAPCASECRTRVSGVSESRTITGRAGLLSPSLDPTAATNPGRLLLNGCNKPRAGCSGCRRGCGAARHRVPREARRSSTDGAPSTRQKLRLDTAGRRQDPDPRATATIPWRVTPLRVLLSIVKSARSPRVLPAPVARRPGAARPPRAGRGARPPRCQLRRHRPRHPRGACTHRPAAVLVR